MTTFKVVDITTGKEISSEKIDKIAEENDLMAIDQFFIGENGQLVLTDNCNNIAYCDMKKLGLMPVFDGKYPDLEYFEALLLGNLRNLHPETFKTNFWQPQAELVDMFPQTWSDTAGGFSEPGMIAGQAFTTEITTVMMVCTHTTKEEYYGVFFGNKLAYIVDHANETFFDDLKNRQMKSKYEAKKAYYCPY